MEKTIKNISINVLDAEAYTKLLNADKDKENTIRRKRFDEIVKFQKWMEMIGNIYLFDHKQMNEAYNIVTNNK